MEKVLEKVSAIFCRTGPVEPLQGGEIEHDLPIGPGFGDGIREVLARLHADQAAGRALGGGIQVDSKLGCAPQPERRGPGVEVDVSRADEAYDLLDRRPQEAVQVMLAY